MFNNTQLGQEVDDNHHDLVVKEGEKLRDITTVNFIDSQDIETKNNYLSQATTKTLFDNRPNTILTDKAIERKESVSIMGNIESSLFHVAYDDLSDNAKNRMKMQVGVTANPAISFGEQGDKYNRRRNMAITESVERKLTGVLYAIILIIIANIYSEVDSSSAAASSSLDPISEALEYIGIPVSSTGLAAIVLGEGFAWIFEEQVMKVYSTLINLSSSESLSDKSPAVPSEAGKDYDTVEIFADLFKWSFFDALNWPFTAYLTLLFGNQNELLFDHSYVQKACVGIIAGPTALMYADTLRQTFHLGKEEYIRQIEQRKSGTWIMIYITRILSTFLLFGLYEYIMTEVSL